MLANWE
jgi:hypothetical protein